MSLGSTPTGEEPILFLQISEPMWTVSPLYKTQSQNTGSARWYHTRQTTSKNWTRVCHHQ